MKSVVILLAAASLVGQVTYAQKRPSGGSERESAPRQEYKAPAQSYKASSQSRSQSTRSDYGSGSSAYNKPARQSYGDSSQQQRPAKSQNTYKPDNSYNKPQSQSRAPAPARENDKSSIPGAPYAQRNRPTTPDTRTAPARTTTPDTRSANNQQRPTANTRPARVMETAQQRETREAGETSNARGHMSAAAQNKLPQSATVHQNKNNTFTVRTGQTTKVEDANGKVIANYNKTTGVNTFRSAGVKTQQQTDGHGHVVSETKTYGGASQATNYVRDNQGRVTSYQRTTVINNVHIYNDNRTYVRVSGNYGYYDVYHPTWWASPAAWYVGTLPIYTGFYMGYGGYSPYWGWSYWGGYQGIAWFPSAYSCGWSGCWSRPAFGFGFGWWDYQPYPYYASYVFPAWYAPVYQSLSWWLADYLVSTAVETDLLYRQASNQAQFDVAKSDAINQIQGDKTNDNGYGLTHKIREIIAKQVEEMVQIIKKKQDGAFQDGEEDAEMDATAMADKGHLFTVNSTISTSTIDSAGNDTPCILQGGDLIGEVYDPATNVRQEPIPVDTDVTPDNPSGQKYVATMYVKASKYGSCAPNQVVTVDVTSLQDMVNDELASVEKGMEKAVALHIGYAP